MKQKLTATNNKRTSNIKVTRLDKFFIGTVSDNTPLLGKMNRKRKYIAITESKEKEYMQLEVEIKNFSDTIKYIHNKIQVSSLQTKFIDENNKLKTVLHAKSHIERLQEDITFKKHLDSLYRRLKTFLEPVYKSVLAANLRSYNLHVVDKIRYLYILDYYETISIYFAIQLKYVLYYLSKIYNVHYDTTTTNASISPYPIDITQEHLIKASLDEEGEGHRFTATTFTKDTLTDIYNK